MFYFLSSLRRGDQSTVFCKGMYVGLKQPRGDGERYVTPARAAAKETRSFAVRDHLRSSLGIFPVWGAFAVGDHLRRCTDAHFFCTSDAINSY